MDRNDVSGSWCSECPICNHLEVRGTQCGSEKSMFDHLNNDHGIDKEVTTYKVGNA